MIIYDDEGIGHNVVPMSVLDMIKAEIVEEKECAYAGFEKYKVEYL